MRVSLSSRSSVNAALKVGLAARLKVVDLLSLREPDAAAFVRDMEKDPLFRNLMGWDGGEPVVRRRPFSRAGFSSRFREINDELLSGGATFDVEGFIGGRGRAAELIKRMGAEDFERHFLFQEKTLSREALATLLGLAPKDVDAVSDFVLDFSARAEFFRSSGPPRPSVTERPFCIGRIEGDAFDGFRVAYDMPHLARGRYRVDRDAWDRRKAALLPPERRRARELIRRAEIFNMRADAFHRVLLEALDAERAWLSGGGREDLKPLSQREAGRRLGLSSGTVCRAVAGRSIRTPWGEEVFLSDLFPQKKRVLREILSASEEDLRGRSDAEAMTWLFERHQLKVPRRTVNYWRRKIEKEGNARAGRG